jgi:calcineurin-like phosphoesterase family protein
MPADIFFISDTHWTHKNILNFTERDGVTKIRPFQSVEEMDELMVQNWNKIVPANNSKVYHLGDVTFRPKHFASIACRLNGKKRLIPGNHDDIMDPLLMQWFEKASIWRIFKDFGFVCTHVPIPPDQFRYKVQFNVHGHVHTNDQVDQWGKPDPIYYNMCVEKNNYSPVHVDELIAKLKAR